MSMQPAWPGFDLISFDNGANPLLSSYTGVPNTIRGTDDANYSRALRGLWAESASPVDASNGVTGDGTPVSPASFGLPNLPGGDTLKKVGIGAAGALVALLVVAFGLLVLWKS